MSIMNVRTTTPKTVSMSLSLTTPAETVSLDWLEDAQVAQRVVRSR